MASSIEEILMAKAMAEAESKIDPAVAMGGGAGVGAVLGAVAPGVRGRNRMASAGVMALLGSLAGKGLENALRGNNQYASMLAKLQTSGGNLNRSDTAKLESVLQNLYSS